MEKSLEKREGRTTTALSPSEFIDRWLSDLFTGQRGILSGQFNWEPKVDIRETDKEVVISASLPGVDKKDISVEVSDHTLSISGERREQKEENVKGYLRREQAYGSFYRAFQLPENVSPEQVKANSKNGLLEIHLPKKEEPQGKGKKVNIE